MNILYKRKIYKVITPDGILWDIEPDNTYGEDDELAYVEYIVIKQNPTIRDINRAVKDTMLNNYKGAWDRVK